MMERLLTPPRITREQLSKLDAAAQDAKLQANDLEIIGLMNFLSAQGTLQRRQDLTYLKKAHQLQT
jgi:hypothetical protein